MAVKHAFTNPKADGADATVTRPSDWNANHTIDAATITLAMHADISVTKRVIGRNTAGAGVPEEVTASQLFDWVSNTNGVLLTRAAGTWGASTNVTLDSDNLTIAETFAPSVPSAGKVKVHGVISGGRAMLSSIGPTGARMATQPLLASRHMYSVEPRNDGGAFTAYNTRLDINGTLTGRTPAATSAFTASHRIGIVSAAGAGSIGSYRSATAPHLRGNAAGMGGFYFYCRHGVSDAVLVATANQFVGLSATTTVLSDVGPETLLNNIGIGCTSGDTVLQLYASGSAAQARTSLGANFPCNTINAELYDVIIFAPPNSSTITWEVIRVFTGDRATGTVSAGASLMSATTMLTWHTHRSNGGTAAATGLDLCGIYGETDY